MGNWRIWVVVLIALAAGVWYVQHAKEKRVSASEPIFQRDRESVQKVIVRKRTDDIVLVNDGGKWQIQGNDSLEVRENRLNDLFDRVLKTHRTTLMTRSPERWTTYTVDDTLGTHLTLVGWEDDTLGTWVFGTSRSDWGKNYVRIGDRPEVYLTDAGVVYHLNTMDTFWGELPGPAEPDSAAGAMGDSLAPGLDLQVQDTE